MKKNTQKRKAKKHLAIRHHITQVLCEKIRSSVIKVSQLSKLSGVPESTIYYLLKGGVLKLSNLCLLASTPQTNDILQPEDIELILNTIIHDSADEPYYPQFSIHLLNGPQPKPEHKSLPDFLIHIRTQLLNLSVRHAARISERCSRKQIESIEKKYLSIGPAVLYRCFESYYQQLPEDTRDQHLVTFAILLMQRLLRSKYNYTFILKEWKQKL